MVRGGRSDQASDVCRATAAAGCMPGAPWIRRPQGPVDEHGKSRSKLLLSATAVPAIAISKQVLWPVRLHPYSMEVRCMGHPQPLFWPFIKVTTCFQQSSFCASPCFCAGSSASIRGHCPYCAEAIEKERSSPDSFSQQPYYYMELACLLLEHAKDCFTGTDDYFKVRRSL